MLSEVLLAVGGIALILAGVGVLIALGFVLWVFSTWVQDKLERRRWAKVPSPFGLLEQPTNRELRRTRKEHSGGNGKENDQKD